MLLQREGEAFRSQWRQRLPPLDDQRHGREAEPPAAPAAPRVTATSGSGWSLEVTWNAPRNEGPPITGYQIRYRKTGDSAATWRQWPHRCKPMSRAGAPR